MTLSNFESVIFLTKRKRENTSLRSVSLWAAFFYSSLFTGFVGSVGVVGVVGVSVSFSAGTEGVGSSPPALEDVSFSLLVGTEVFSSSLSAGTEVSVSV